jgi:L-lactate utilization protein LutB
MIVFFDGEFAISSDERQWKVVKLYNDKKNGKIVEQPMTFHSTLHGAVDSLFHRRVRSSEYESIQDLANAVESIREEILSVLNDRVPMKIEI